MLYTKRLAARATSFMIVTLFLFSPNVRSQENNIPAPASNISGWKHKQVKHLAVTSDGGYIVAGTINGVLGNDTVAKIDIDGNLTGYDIRPITGNWLWISKLGINGNMEWEKHFDGGNDYPISIKQTADNGYIVAASHNSKNNWIMKLTNTGTLEWQRVLVGDLSDGTNAIEQTDDGGYVMVGDSDLSMNYNTQKRYNRVLKLNKKGDTEWERLFSISDGSKATCIRQTKEGGYVVALNGRDTTNNAMEVLDTFIGLHGNILYESKLYSGYVVKFTNNGTIEWKKKIGTPDLCTEIFSVFQTLDNGYIISGMSRPHYVERLYDVNKNALIIKMDNAGNTEWQKTFGEKDSIDETANVVAPTKDGGYIITGLKSYKHSSVKKIYDTFAVYNDSNILEKYEIMEKEINSCDSVVQYDWMAKIDSRGGMESQKLVGRYFGDYTNGRYFGDYTNLNSFEQTRDGGFIMWGERDRSNSHETENEKLLSSTRLIVVDSKGIVEWKKKGMDK